MVLERKFHGSKGAEVRIEVKWLGGRWKLDWVIRRKGRELLVVLLR